MYRKIRIANAFDHEKLATIIRNLVEESNPDYQDYDDQYLYMTDCISPGSSGIHQSGEIISRFNLRIPNDGWAWGEIGTSFNEAADVLQRRVSILIPDIDFSLYFGNSESNGDFGLFVLWGD